MRHVTVVAPEPTTGDFAYDLDSATPRSSISYTDSKHQEIRVSPLPDPVPAPASTSNPPTPSIPLLFSQLSRHHVVLLLIPAILSSVIAGGVAPFMTHVVGQSFATFAAFPQDNATSEDKDRLLRGVGMAAIQLVALAFGAFALSSLTSCLWIWTGEQNVMALRQRVYDGISHKNISWFDASMGSDDVDQGTLGPAGLMAKFTSETEDIRTATSLAAGQLIQYLTTCLACLLLAFIRSWSLTLVILSAVPLLMIIQTISQALAGPLLASERSITAKAATIVDRFVTSISTVKAFTAETFELSVASRTYDDLSHVANRLNAVWGVTSGLAQFTMFAMFVQGFWFGAKLVREGKVSPGNVMTVFWACLIATSNLQMCIPQFIALAKGKFAMAALLALAGEEADSVTPSSTPTTPTFTLPRSPRKGQEKPPRNFSLHRIQPPSCPGEFSFHNVTFTHANRTTPTLSGVFLFLPAGETTFVVGSSGSGKSTIAHMLLKLYIPEFGQVCLDDRDTRFLDEKWMRSCVVGVGQGWGVDVVLEGRTVRENVALGVEGVLGADVEGACRGVMLDEFVRGLPRGYETVLGGTGVALSGGQRQRLALARAWLRDPPVLVLDEATSALDPTTRVIVFENLKAHRRGKTTIVITHDLSQITQGDFVYVMKSGEVVEQGFRCDLEKDCGTSSGNGKGEFRKMLDVQLGMGGFLPTQDLDDVAPSPPGFEEEEEEDEDRDPARTIRRHTSFFRPLSLGGWIFDAIADLTSTNHHTNANATTATTTMTDPPSFNDRTSKAHRRITLQVAPLSAPPTVVERKRAERRLSLQFTPSSPVFSTFSANSDATLADVWSCPSPKEITYDTEGDLHDDKSLVNLKRATVLSERRKSSFMDIKVEGISTEPVESFAPATFWKTIKTAYPTIPNKPILFLGLVICLFSGAMTPLFSVLLSRLLFEVSTGARNMSIINKYGGIVLSVAATDGILLGLKYFIMESCGMAWITHLRKRITGLVLKQDKAWFDKSQNSAVRLVQLLVKDGDDARNLVAVVMGQCLVVGSMLAVGLLWALVWGWQLTLVGLGIAPVFVGVMAVQTRLVAGCEGRNKRAREEVGRGFYTVVVNVRGARAMSGLEKVFKEEFRAANRKAKVVGVKGAVVEGCTYGVASGLIYLSEALLFYVGAVLIAKGTYTYLQMVEVLNLVVFTITIGSQLMAFTQRIAKSVQATHDLNQLLKLQDLTPSESTGSLLPPAGTPITLNNVNFSYPERPDVPVLKNVNLTIQPGEHIALVGLSGSGKSTIAALLQRLYEPSSGSISLGSTRLADVDVRHLRQHLSVVSQHPNLFDDTISENIKYGSAARPVSELDVRRAAKQANIHEFVMGLEEGYDTPIGENATLLSGGQAQRLQIARALARDGDVLILDECTSALDVGNQAAVMEAIAGIVKERGTTTIMVTHKVEVMRMCSRIVVLDEGEIKEEGSFDELMRRKGVFAALTRGGEWAADS